MRTLKKLGVEAGGRLKRDMRRMEQRQTRRSTCRAAKREPKEKDGEFAHETRYDAPKSCNKKATYFGQRKRLVYPTLRAVSAVDNWP
jgi:hypothetical protein